MSNTVLHARVEALQTGRNGINNGRPIIWISKSIYQLRFGNLLSLNHPHGICNLSPLQTLRHSGLRPAGG